MAQRRRHTKQQGAGKSGGRGWSHADTSPGMRAATESRRMQRVDTALESHREHSPANMVTWAPGSQNHTDRYFSFFKPPGLWQCLTGDLGSQHTYMMESKSLRIRLLEEVSTDAQVGALLSVTTLRQAYTGCANASLPHFPSRTSVFDTMKYFSHLCSRNQKERNPFHQRDFHQRLDLKPLLYILAMSLWFHTITVDIWF